jgi:hypothetical protein
MRTLSLIMVLLSASIAQAELIEVSAVIGSGSFPISETPGVFTVINVDGFAWRMPTVGSIDPSYYNQRVTLTEANASEYDFNWPAASAFFNAGAGDGWFNLGVILGDNQDIRLRQSVGHPLPIGSSLVHLQSIEWFLKVTPSSGGGSPEVQIWATLRAEVPEPSTFALVLSTTTLLSLLRVRSRR